MIQIVVLFLIAMAVLAVVGRIKRGVKPSRRVGKCSACGRPRIGKGPCMCGKKG